jgi:hypothetical protein
MDFNTQVKLALYRHFAATGRAPTVGEVSAEVDAGAADIRRSYGELRAMRVLWLEGDGETIRMAPPFSGVPTQHVVRVGAVEYFANCAWDALGIPAALHEPGLVRSECGQTREPLSLRVGLEGPTPTDWVFHCLVPAAHWWRDLVFT